MIFKGRQSGLMVRAVGSLACLLAGFAATAGLAEGPSLAMLDRLDPGLWAIHPRDETGNETRLCAGSGRRLIQIRHSAETCRQFVIEDGPGAVTVQYTCPGKGYGRTRLRFENARLVQLETQGIENGLPFNFAAEARRVASCGR